MKLKSRIFALLLSFSMALSMMPAMTITAFAATPKVKSVSLNYKTYTIKKGKTVKLKATAKPKKSAKKFTWKTSNKKIASVKNGKVKGLKKGKVTITATAKGSSKKAKATIYVGTPVKKAVFSKKSITLEKGKSQTVTAKLQPKKPTLKGIVYSSSNKKVATVNQKGKIKAVGKGTAQIIATPKDQAGKKAVLTVKVTEPAKPANPANPANPAKPAKPAKPANPANPEKKELKAKASNESELKKALADSNVTEITLTSVAEESIEIPKGTYTDKVLIIDDANAHVENHGLFKSVIIKAISNNSFVEYAVGNIIKYLAQTGTLRIEEAASAKLNIEQGASSLKVVNNGSIGNINIAAKINITIQGSSNNSIPVDVQAEAANSDITTSQELDMTTAAKVDLKIGEGAEHTQVNIVSDDAEAAVPDISGLGVICIRHTDEYYRNLVAQNDNKVEVTKTVTVKGSIDDAEGNGLENVTVAIIPHREEMEIEDVIKEALNPTTTDATNEDGEYSFSDIKAGNYYLVVKKDGYASEVSKLIITSNSADVFNASPISMTVNDNVEKTGPISGQLSDAETGNSGEEGLTVMLRQGGNNTSGTILETATTDAEGKFKFNKSYPFGVYTIEIVDKRKNEDSSYITTSMNVVVKSEEENIAEATASKTIEGDQVRFVLSWGDQASGASADLDSHLVGPTADGKGKFHTWYSDLSYYMYGDSDEYDRVKYADLDVDDVDWVGPETTTIYKKSNGNYSFYIHDFTNKDHYSSSQMSKSQAKVEVYKGKTLYTTYVIPTNKAGVLWHVCDYDAAKNKIIGRNEIISSWTGQPWEVGLSAEDILKNAKDRLNDAIEEAQNIYDNMSDSSLKEEGASLIEAARSALQTNDALKISEAASNLESWIEIAGDVFYIKDVVAYGDGEEENLIRDWYEQPARDDEGDLPYNELVLTGDEDTIPDNIQVQFASSDVEYNFSDSDKEGYSKKLTATCGEENKVWYVKYGIEPTPTFQINKIVAYDDDNENLIVDWAEDAIWDEDYENILYRELVLMGKGETMPENIQPEFALSDVEYSLSDSDKDGYLKKLTATCGEESRVWYVKYEQNVSSAFNIFNISAHENYEDLLTGWNQHYVYDDNNNPLFTELLLKGIRDTMPENIQVEFAIDGVEYSFSDSDKEGYSKKLTATYEGERRVWYVKYERDTDLDFYIDNVVAYNGDETENLLTEWDDRNVWDEDDENISYKELVLKGTGETLSADTKINVEFQLPDVEYSFSDSDKEGYLKKLTATYEGETRVWYVRYERDIYRLLRIKEVVAYNEYGEYGSPDNLCTMYYTDGDGSEDVLEIEGKSDTIPEHIDITFENEKVQYELLDSDKDGYQRKLVIDLEGETHVWYVRYYLSYEYAIGIGSINVKTKHTGDDGEEYEDYSSISYDADYHNPNEFDPNDNESYVILYVYSEEEDFYSKMSIETSHPNAILSDLKDSDLEAYEKMFTVSYGEGENAMERKYYMQTKIPDDVKFGFSFYDKYDNWVEFEISEVDEYDVVIIKGKTPSIDDLVVTTNSTKTEATIVDSDIDGYDKMLVLTYEDETRKYYIDYRLNIGISRIIYSEDGETQDVTYFIEGDDGIPTLYIEGRWEELPIDKLEFVSDIEGATCTYNDGVLTVTLGDESREFAVIYSMEDFYRYQFTASSQSDDYLQLSYGWDYDSYYDEEWEEYIPVMTVYGSSDSIPEDVVFEKGEYCDDIIVEDSNIEGYKKIVTLTFGDDSKTCLIRYECDPELS